MIKTRKFSVIIILCFILISLINGCSKKIESISFDFEELEIYCGDVYDIGIKTIPLVDKDLVFEIAFTEDGIASCVDNKITALKEGTTIVELIYNNEVYDRRTISVIPVLPESIKFLENDYYLGIGRTIDLGVEISPLNTTDKYVHYMSEDLSIAKVVDGKIIGVAEGETMLTAIHSSGLKSTQVIIVYPIEINDFKIMGEGNLLLESSETLMIDFNPIDTTDKEVVWESSDESIISVNGGEIIGLKLGEASIKATHSSGKTNTIDITVMPVLAEAISISNSNSISLYPKETIILDAVIMPENATDKSVNWTSDDETIAKVNNSGKVTALKSGSTLIRVNTNNSMEATYRIAVKPTTKDMRVSITSKCSDYNHVGNEWGKYLSCENNEISSGDYITASLNKNISVYTKIMEYDSITDVGTSSSNVNVSEEFFENGFVLTQTIYVRENRGRYSGNIATWTVEYKFSP